MPTLVLAISLSILLLPSSVFAQTTSATLSGTIKDTSGGVLPGVSIEARNVATNDTRTAVSETTGVYRFTNLPRGTYAVKAELQGFKTAQSQVVVTVGDTVRLDLAMEVGALAETVQVEGHSPLVNTEEGRLSYLVDEKRVAELPLNGRNAFQLMELQPGASTNPGNAVLGGSAGGNTGVHQRSEQQGQQKLSPRRHGTTTISSPPAARPSIQRRSHPGIPISTNNFSAEFGRNSASAVNVVTKSGTNQLHGTR
jgi:hypothetical protein